MGCLFYSKLTRITLFTAGLMSSSPHLFFLVFIIVCSNFGVPPTLPFFQEVGFISAVMSTRAFIVPILCAYILLTSFFSLYLAVEFYRPRGSTL